MTPALILASASPRRQELIAELDIPFEVIPSIWEEPPPAGEKPEAYAQHLAEQKAYHVALEYPDRVVLGADTVVALDGEIFGKPQNLDDGIRILTALQGTTHQVITGISLQTLEPALKETSFATSHVTMRPLSPEEIHDFAIKHTDKAGGYAVQDKDDPVVTQVEGSYSNVVGLPLELLKEIFVKLSLFDFKDA